jgi:hypothetical protein
LRGTVFVVKGKIPSHVLLGHPQVLVVVQIHLLVFDRAPQPLDEDVVEEPPATRKAWPALIADAGNLLRLAGFEYTKFPNVSVPLVFANGTKVEHRDPGDSVVKPR